VLGKVITSFDRTDQTGLFNNHLSPLLLLTDSLSEQLRAMLGHTQRLNGIGGKTLREEFQKGAYLGNESVG
jgi:hypothetical protein